MKEQTNNEMDLLLRRLGRRDEHSVSAGGHLDADELSGYAENALPAAARARYTAHLAECSRCRQLVVQLSSAAGVVAVSEATHATKPSGWKSFLASLFTPMVLRYAAPALGLIVVAVIGWVVLRRENSPKFVTQVTTNEQRPAERAAAEPTVAFDSGPTEDKNARGFVDQQAKKQQSQAGPASPPNTPPAVSSVEAEVSKDKSAAQPNVEQRPVTANEAPPSPKTEPSATPEERQKTAAIEAQKKEARDVPSAAPAAAKDLRFEAEREDKDNSPRAANRKSKPANAVIATQGAGSVGRMDSLSANTRTVAGRRFQKKGGVWIDTAYDSSKDSMTLARGSEQYRTLVGDEPEIKTIADALEGEIIVVWKGHTYRIH